MRIAIIGSPRSGNSWVRKVLAQALDLREISVHNWMQFPADAPANCILQIHWYKEPNFQAFLAKNEFRIVILARHPLDVLLSALHFVRHEPEANNWLGGNCAFPSALLNASPSSKAFETYAKSDGSEHLLSVSYQWWNDHNAIRVRYEDIVLRPEIEFKNIIAILNADDSNLLEAINNNNLDSFRSLSNHHGWQGTPGLWKRLIPNGSAFQIYLHHYNIFKTLRYPPPLSWATRFTADREWNRLKL